MQDIPLSITHLFDRAEKYFGHKQVVTATAAGRERVTYGDWAAAHTTPRRRARHARHLR